MHGETLKVDLFVCRQY